MIRYWIAGMIWTAGCLAVPAGRLHAEAPGGFQINHRYDRPVGRTGVVEPVYDPSFPSDAGSMVYIYWRNGGDVPRQVNDLRWEGADYAQWSGADHGYQAIWRSFRPETVAPGSVGEVAIALRHALVNPVAFTLKFGDGTTAEVTVSPQNAPVRFGTIAFTPDLRRARCFLESESDLGNLPLQLVCDGKPGNVAWWSEEFAHGVRVAELTFDTALTPGERVTFLVRDESGALLTGASLRAFGDLATCGTYGSGDLRRYAENGLDSFNSLGAVAPDMLDQAEMLGMRTVVGSYQQASETAGRPGVYAYLLFDEPDCHDYAKWTERPYELRLGGYAPEMLSRYQSVGENDPAKPALLTVDLTYTPLNYFVYGPLADISNPDIYTNTSGWSVKFVDLHLAMVKQGTAPRPFAYSYQSCWEEWSNFSGPWANEREILAKGFDAFVDKTKSPRGFGVNTNPDEMAIAIHYALKNGATAFFAFMDMTGASGGIVFHGSNVLPENWDAVVRNSRKIARIGALLSPAHPITLAEATGPVAVGTLLTDKEHLLVVAVNENYHYDQGKFTITESDTCITVPALPWLQGASVLRVTDKGFEPVAFRIDGDRMQWSGRVRNGEIYLVSASEAAAQCIVDADARRERHAAALLTAEAAARAQEQILIDQLRKSGTPIVGSAIHGYMLAAEDFPALPGERYNAFESWEEHGVTPMGSEWVIPVSRTQVGRVHEVLWTGRISGSPARIEVLAPDGSAVLALTTAERSLIGGRTFHFTPPEAGDYRVRITGTPDQETGHGCRIERRIFVLAR